MASPIIIWGSKQVSSSGPGAACPGWTGCVSERTEEVSVWEKRNEEKAPVALSSRDIADLWFVFNIHFILYPD